MQVDAVRSLARELQLTRSSHDHTLYFHGTSMEPFLREGDRVIVEDVDWADLRPGDIVTYRDEEKFPTRRVYRMGQQRLHVRCDRWLYYRAEVRREDLLGRAVARLREGSWLRCSDPRWREAAREALRTYRRDDITKAIAAPILHVLRALKLR